MLGALLSLSQQRSLQGNYKKGPGITIKESGVTTKGLRVTIKGPGVTIKEPGVMVGYHSGAAASFHAFGFGERALLFIVPPIR
jgi:hypothetical protein